MAKLKVITIVGTRPEIIKLSRVIAELEIHTVHYLIHTGQNYDYELNQIFFDQLKIRKPDYFLNAAESSAAVTIANIIKNVDSIIEELSPDAALLYGDTNSCLSVIALKRKKVPVFHMEAGNRCFDLRVPEEINRKIVDHLSDINLTISEHARKYLISEGIRPEQIIKIGSSMPEVLQFYRKEIEKSGILEEEKLTASEYFLVSIHREENLDNDLNLNNFLETLQAIAEAYKKKIIISTHPRTKKKLSDLKININNNLIKFMKPFGFFEYIKLQMNAFCVLSDSGTISEESAILGFPALMIRQAHERPEAMDVAAVIMCGLEKNSVLNSINLITEKQSLKINNSDLVDDYRNKDISITVVRLIYSYTDYVNRFVWRKHI
jgi:UDP-N-acetylglucosamine 2-epimerase